jgi:Tol biopolymer transport system component
VVALSETGDSFGVGSHEVFLIGQNQENFRSMKVEGLDFRPQWSPTGDQLLYSVAGSENDWKPSLWVVDASGDSIGANRRNLNIETWADKCTYADTSTLYCGIPDELERGYGLQPGLADSTPDTIYRIDLTTGLRTRVAIPEGSHTVESIMLSPDEKWLYFTDKVTGYLNKIQLTE